MESLLQQLSNLLEQGTIAGPLISLVAGILTSMMPCSLPMLPIIIGYLSAGKKDSRASIKTGLVYSAGIITMMILLAAAASLLGKIFNQQSRIFQLILGILLLLMAAQTAGFYEFISPRYVKGRSESYLGIYFTGILMGVFSSPCTTPVIVTLIGIASQTSRFIYSLILFLMYGIGTCFLVMLAAISVGKMNQIIESDRYRNVSVWIQRILALLIAFMGIYFIYQAL